MNYIEIAAQISSLINDVLNAPVTIMALFLMVKATREGCKCQCSGEQCEQASQKSLNDVSD